MTFRGKITWNYVFSGLCPHRIFLTRALCIGEGNVLSNAAFAGENTGVGLKFSMAPLRMSVQTAFFGKIYNNEKRMHVGGGWFCGVCDTGCRFVGRYTSTDVLQREERGETGPARDDRTRPGRSGICPGIRPRILRARLSGLRQFGSADCNRICAAPRACPVFLRIQSAPDLGEVDFPLLRWEGKTRTGNRGDCEGIVRGYADRGSHGRDIQYQALRSAGRRPVVAPSMMRLNGSKIQPFQVYENSLKTVKSE